MSEIKEVKVGSVVTAVWPDDKFHKPRPGVVVSALTDEYGTQWRVVYGTSKRADRGLSSSRPWHVFIDATQAPKLGLDGEGLFDLSCLRYFSVGLEVVGHVSALSGFKERLVKARMTVPRPF